MEDLIASIVSIVSAIVRVGIHDVSNEFPCSSWKPFTVQYSLFFDQLPKTLKNSKVIPVVPLKIRRPIPSERFEKNSLEILQGAMDSSNGGDHRSYDILLRSRKSTDPEGRLSIGCL
jgi:hypothetical protein